MKNRLTLFFTFTAIGSMIIGAFWGASNTTPEWRTVSVPEEIVLFDSINGAYFALSKTDEIYICSNASYAAWCGYSGFSENERQEIASKLVDTKDDDGPRCQAIKESLFRFLDAEQVIVDCEVPPLDQRSSADAEFLVDSQGIVWQRISHRLGVVSSGMYGTVVGAWGTLALAAPVSLFVVLLRRFRCTFSISWGVQSGG